MLKPGRVALLGCSVVALLALQLLQPEAPGPVRPGDGPISDHLSVPADVNALLREACYDCHSGETRWPWYSRVSPVSWLIARHVRHGRSNLDFSRWSTDPVLEPTPAQRLKWTCEEVRDGLMPPLSYRLAHPGARLDDREKESICAWTGRALLEIGATSSPRPGSRE